MSEIACCGTCNANSNHLHGWRAEKSTFLILLLLRWNRHLLRDTLLIVLLCLLLVHVHLLVVHLLLVHNITSIYVYIINCGIVSSATATIYDDSTVCNILWSYHRIIALCKILQCNWTIYC